MGALSPSKTDPTAAIPIWVAPAPAEAGVIPALPVSIAAGGTINIVPSKVATAVVDSLASQATTIQLLAANASRGGLMVTNTDANDLYLKYGATASLTSFTVRIPFNGYWEMPAAAIYTGRIDVIWAADGSGSAIYTEL
jgi:hypothetical protein